MGSFIARVHLYVSELPAFPRGTRFYPNDVCSHNQVAYLCWTYDPSELGLCCTCSLVGLVSSVNLGWDTVRSQRHIFMYRNSHIIAKNNDTVPICSGCMYRVIVANKLEHRFRVVRGGACRAKFDSRISRLIQGDPFHLFIFSTTLSGPGLVYCGDSK